MASSGFAVGNVDSAIAKVLVMTRLREVQGLGAHLLLPNKQQLIWRVSHLVLIVQPE
jgi:hypothetical protein